jgi:hypothetical protein
MALLRVTAILIERDAKQRRRERITDPDSLALGVVETSAVLPHAFDVDGVTDARHREKVVLSLTLPLAPIVVLAPFAVAPPGVTTANGPVLFRGEESLSALDAKRTVALLRDAICVVIASAFPRQAVPRYALVVVVAGLTQGSLEGTLETLPKAAVEVGKTEIIQLETTFWLVAAMPRVARLGLPTGLSVAQLRLAAVGEEPGLGAIGCARTIVILARSLPGVAATSPLVGGINSRCIHLGRWHQRAAVRLAMGVCKAGFAPVATSRIVAPLGGAPTAVQVARAVFVVHATPIFLPCVLGKAQTKRGGVALALALVVRGAETQVGFL